MEYRGRKNFGLIRFGLVDETRQTHARMHSYTKYVHYSWICKFVMENDNRKYYAQKKMWSVQISCIYHQNENDIEQRDGKNEQSNLTKCLHTKRMFWLIILIPWYERKRMTMPTTWLLRFFLTWSAGISLQNVWVRVSEGVHRLWMCFFSRFFVAVVTS